MAQSETIYGEIEEMMTTTAPSSRSLRETFIQSIQKMYESSQKKQSEEGLHHLASFQREAWKKWLEIGLPHKKTAGYEKFPFSSFLSLLVDIFQSPPSPERKIQKENDIFSFARKSFLALHSGQWNQSLSNREDIPPSIQILSLGEGRKRFSPFFSLHEQEFLKEEKNPFLLLNGALAERGLFTYVPSGVISKIPVQILLRNNLSPNTMEGKDTGEASSFSSSLSLTRSHFLFGKGSETTLLFYIPEERKNVAFHHLDFILETEAQANIIFISRQREEQHHVHLYTRADLREKSNLRLFHIHSGNGMITQNDRLSLSGREAHVSLRSLTVRRGTGKYHIDTKITHKYPSTYSDQLCKIFLHEKSSSSFRGNTCIEPQAEKSVASQENHNYLLSDQAAAHTEPSLQIFADDVSASHGATVSDLEKESLLYLRMRGFHPTEASKILLKSLCHEIISYIPIQELHDNLYQFTALANR